MLTEAAVATASNIKPGSHTIDIPGVTRYHAMSPRRTRKATAKSTRGAMTADPGINSRGKYTFEMMRWYRLTEVLPPVRADAKYVHGTRAANAKTGYGRPSDGTFAKRPKKIVNTTIVITGWMTAQPAPSAVCL